MKTKTFKIYSFFFLFILAFTFGGCKKDLGNYDYQELNELKSVDNLGIINATYAKTLKITPQITFTKDPNFNPDNYTYEWSYSGSNGLGGTKIWILSTEKDLDILVKIPEGSYTAYYCITDKASGVKYRQQFKLIVKYEISGGWILMNSVNNQARVDMIWQKSTGESQNILDLLSYTKSDLKLTGKPIMAYSYPSGLLPGPDAISYALYLGTDNYSTKVDRSTYSWTKTMGLEYEMYGNIPAGFYADVISQRGSGSSSYMIGNKDVYLYDRIYSLFYSTPLNFIAAEQKSFDVAPFIGLDIFSSGANAIFYDATNKRFVKHVGTAATCTVLPEPSAADKLFSFNVGLDLVYMRFINFNGGEVFAVFKDGNKRILARFNPANNKQSYYAEILGTDISNAENFAFSPDLGYVFYNVGSKIYEYDTSLRTSKLMLDYGSKKISYMNFYEFKAFKTYTTSNYLNVGVYDPAGAEGTNGSFYRYQVPNINGDLVLKEQYSDFGKIKDLTYRE